MRTLALFVIGLVFGGGIGFVTAAGMGVTFDGHDHADPAHHAGSADHAAHDSQLDFGDGGSALGLSMDLTKDPVAGYNLHLRGLNGFTMAPQNAGLANVPGEGHAHVYVNGTKIARLYGQWFHIPALPSGENRVTVTLNANDHSTYTLDGDPIELTQIVVVE